MVSSSTRVAILFLCLLAGAEAERIHTAAALAESARAQIAAHDFRRGAGRNKTMDLDWAGCAKKTGMVFGKSCSEVSGCARQRLWLDTPRQSCRFTDQHKLLPQNVLEFLPVELARLEEKSATFAAKGCLFGGWFMKCYRRIRQVVRLLRYVRRAVADAKADASHPAHALASSPETARALNKTADNIAEGFRKASQGFPEGGEDFGGGLELLRSMPDSLRKAAEDTEQAENRSLTSQEKAAMEDMASVEAMLKVTGTELDDEQRAELYAQIEGNNPPEGSEDQLDADVDDMVDSLDEALAEADSEDMANLKKQTGTVDDDQEDPEDAAAKADESAGSLVQLAGQSDSNLAGAVQARGTGPLKWIFINGGKWIVTRVAWLLLFLVGSASGLIRPFVIFPLLFAGCTLAKFFIWVVRDVGYNIGWNGNSSLAVKRFKNIGTCAPWMWNFMNFDTSAKNILWKMFVRPSRFASRWTGVHHLWKGEEALCASVKCGSHTTCRHGECLCMPGYYPNASSPGHCALAVTSAGCRCKANWTATHNIIFSKRHYGCPASGRCKPDQEDPSYSTCVDKIKTGRLSFASPRDSCTHTKLTSTVPAIK